MSDFRIRFLRTENLPGKEHPATVPLISSYSQAEANQALFEFRSDDVYKNCAPILEVNRGGIWLRSGYDPPMER